MPFWTRLGLGALALLLASSPSGLRAQVLYAFSGPDGQWPEGGLVQDGAGAFFGTTLLGGTQAGSPGGTVFKLVPPPAGSKSWVEQVIYDFPGSANDGAYPTGSLLADASGSLFGTTTSGQGTCVYGTIFQLSPPASGTGAWTESILHVFQLSDGSAPQGNLIRSSSGALYGVAGGGNGSVFRLSPPAAGRSDWRLQTLHTFGLGEDGLDPTGRLAMDGAGNLYGVTHYGRLTDYGTVFKLARPAAGQSEWTETILYTFLGTTDGSYPVGGLSIDAQGTLYGTTSGGGSGTTCLDICGTVFRLVPPAVAGGAWTHQVIHDFNGADGDYPADAPVLDRTGNLFGTTAFGGFADSQCYAGCGVLYRLAPPAAGAGSWTETFHASPNGKFPTDPLGDLLLTKDGYVYGTSRFGGFSSPSDGTVFRMHQ